MAEEFKMTEEQKTLAEIVEEAVYEVCETRCRFMYDLRTYGNHSEEEFDEFFQKNCVNCPLNKLV